MIAYPALTVLLPLAVWFTYRLQWRRMRRELPEMEWLPARWALASREQGSMAVGFLALAVAGAWLYGHRTGAWVAILGNAGLAVLCAYNARRWHRRTRTVRARR